MNKMIKDIAEFQQTVLGNAPLPRPTYDRETAAHLVLCAQEEVNELNEAVLSDNFPEVVDAAIDAIYFLLGGLYQLGVDPQRAWDAVHAANMQKFYGLTHRGMEGDAAKPAGWSQPDHSWVNGPFEALKEVAGG